MNKNKCFTAAAMAAMLLGASGVATATTINLGANVTYQEQFGDGTSPSFDLFVINNTSDAGVQIESITIDISTTAVAGALFDIVAGGPGVIFGVGNDAPFTPGAVGGAATGFTGTLNEFDGSTSVTLLFADFDAGESVTFATDLDHDDGVVADHNLSGAEMEGATLSVTFVGGFTTTTLLGTFLNQLGPPPGDALATVSGQVNMVPEPATLGLLAAGLIGLGLGRRQKRQKQR